MGCIDVFVFLYYVADFEVLLDALLRGFEERGAKYSEDPRSLMFSNYISNVKFIDFSLGIIFIMIVILIV